MRQKEHKRHMNNKKTKFLMQCIESVSVYNLFQLKYNCIMSQNQKNCIMIHVLNIICKAIRR